MGHCPQHLIKVTDQFHAWAAVPPGREFSVTSEQVVGGCTQTQSECCGEEEKLLFLPGIKAQSHVCPNPQLGHYITSAMLDLTVL